MPKKPFLLVALLAIALTVWSSAVQACNTPVYRYAMYNWQTAPYIVFYFYEGEIPEVDLAVHNTIEKLTEEWPPEANVQIEPIEVSDEKKMEMLPEFVIEEWKSYEDGKTPTYVVFSPFRAHVYSGELDAESVQKLIESPARKKFGELLGEGNAAVMLLLTCPDEAENKKAEEALAELQEMAESDEIPVEIALPPMGLPGEGDEASGEDAPDPNKLGIAVLKVDRNDPAEEFFVRMLMSIENDLHEYADQPMIFAGYGRGRAMEPYIGKGITAQNLVDVVAFLAGACSCMVKEQNPGADLLMKWNWEATADKMAENDPTLDYGPYGPYGYGEVAADPATAEDAEAEAAAKADGETAEPASDEAAETTTEVAQASVEGAETATGETAGDEDPASPPDEAGEPEAEAVAAEPVSSEAEGYSATSDAATQGGSGEASSFSTSRMMTYAFGFGAIAVGVLLAGLALILRKS